MADQPLTGIVQRISHKCTFPAASELEDTKCYICLNDSLGPQGSEVPAKLRCGHIFGMACLVKWVSDSIAEGKASPTCPICRGIFLGRAKFLNYHPSLASSAQQEDDEEQDDDGTTPEQRGRWYRQLIASTRVPGRIEFSETDECFIIRAEHRWVHFCKAIYNHIDDLVDPSESANDLLREYFDEQLPIAQYILSYSTVYNFFVAWLQSNLEFSQMMEVVHRWIPTECEMLTTHLSTHNGVDNGARWRISQGCGTEFAARLHWRQARLRHHLDRVSAEWRSMPGWEPGL